MFLLGCISSVDLTESNEASQITNQCFELVQPAFVYEGRCADLSGFNDNSELCNSIQTMGEGVFPQSWENYLQQRDSFDKTHFDKLAFEKQRTMLFALDAGTKVTITRVVHHGWGTDGRYWVFRGNLINNGKSIEVELPSFSKVHLMPYWLNGRSKNIPELNSKFIGSCKP